MYNTERRQYLTVSQKGYKKYLLDKKLNQTFESTLKQVKAAAGGLGWRSTQTRLDISFRVSQLNRLILDVISTDASRLVNRIIEYVLQISNRGVSFPRMDLNTLYVAFYGDASLASNHDLSSQIGGIVCLRDAKESGFFLSWFSKNILRVVTSILAGELIAAVTAFDLAFALRHALTAITGRHLELYLYTDSYRMFSTITRFESIREKRLLIDLSVLRQG